MVPSLLFKYFSSCKSDFSSGTTYWPRCTRTKKKGSSRIRCCHVASYGYRLDIFLVRHNQLPSQLVYHLAVDPATPSDCEHVVLDAAGCLGSEACLGCNQACGIQTTDGTSFPSAVRACMEERGLEHGPRCTRRISEWSKRIPSALVPQLLELHASSLLDEADSVAPPSSGGSWCESSVVMQSHWQVFRDLHRCRCLFRTVHIHLPS